VATVAAIRALKITKELLGEWKVGI
jgi:hypothetical protein